MTENRDSSNRIPSELIANSDNVQSWTLPSMDSGSKSSKVVLTGEKDRAARKKQVAGEVVEDYKPQGKPKPITAEQLKEITEQAHKDGLEEGYREGLNKGMAEGSAQGLIQGKEQAYNEYSQKLDDEYKRLKAIGDALAAPLAEQDSHLENTVLDLAVRLAEHLLQSEIQQDPTQLFRLVEGVVNELPVGADNVNVSLNSHDIHLIEQYIPEAQKRWSLQRDESLQTGGCRVESNNSLVNFDLKPRMEAFLQQIDDLNHSDLNQEKNVGDGLTESDTLEAPITDYAKAFHDEELKRQAMDDARLNRDKLAEQDIENTSQLDEAKIDLAQSDKTSSDQTDRDQTNSEQKISDDAESAASLTNKSETQSNTETEPKVIPSEETGKEPNEVLSEELIEKIVSDNNSNVIPEPNQEIVSESETKKDSGSESQP